MGPFQAIIHGVKKSNALSTFLRRWKNSAIKNLYNTDFDRIVLISYIISPFKNPNYAHTNNIEATTIAKIFHELGYQVDICHFENPPRRLDKYQVIYGFGDVFQQCFQNNLKNVITIYYGTGMHVSNQNNKSLNRVRDVYLKKGVWLLDSARFVEKTWTHQTTLVDAIIALGNQECAISYQKYYKGNLFTLNAPYFEMVNPLDVIKSRDHVSNKSYLWFGSRGLIHKGLDLCLDFFKKNVDYELHICGSLENEPEFVKVYKDEIFNSPNIKYHGFVNINSSKFKEILKMCSFIISPSCSEGGSPSVLNVVGNGALIPLLTKESTLTTGFEISIEDLTDEALNAAITYSNSLSENEIKVRQLRNLEYVREFHSQMAYYVNLKKIINQILK